MTSLIDAALWLMVRMVEKAANGLASLFGGREPDEDKD